MRESRDSYINRPDPEISQRKLTRPTRYLTRSNNIIKPRPEI